MDFKNVAQKKITFEGVELYNPVISELSEIYDNEEDFFFVLNLMNTTLKDKIQFNGEELEVIKDITDFQIIYSLLVEPQDIGPFTQKQKQCIISFLLLIFKDYQLSFNNGAMIFSNPNNNTYVILNNNNFETFKQIVSKMFNIKNFFKGKQEEEFNVQDERAKAIADKIKKGRQKAAENSLGTLENGIIENYISILSTGFKIPPSDICEKFTFYNLVACYNRFISQEAWDLEIKARLAGAEAREDSPENWIKFN